MEKATTQFKNFTGKTSEFSNERADCTVYALARAFDIPYEKAHKLLKKAGRNDGSGFHLENLFGYKKSRVFLGRRIGYHRRLKKHPTIMTFMKKHPNGRYILRVPRHVCVLIDGVLHGQSMLGQRVNLYWYISDLRNTNPQPETEDSGVSIESLPIKET